MRRSHPIARRWVLGWACLLAATWGCDPPGDDRLVIATSWRADDRRRIEVEFARWLEDHPQATVRGIIRLDWLILSPGDDPERLAARRSPPDVILGGPARAFERLARSERLLPLPGDDSRAWAVARRGLIRPIASGASEVERDLVTRRGGVAFDDPRQDPVSLAWAEAQLGGQGFSLGYARLVRMAGEGDRFGRLAGSASAALERGEARRALEVIWVDAERAGSEDVPWTDGVAIVAGGRHREMAASFLRFLAETGRAGSAPPGRDPESFDELDLLADLLGATLVDAQDELHAAWSALERAGSPPTSLHWMTEPPPWPPASIANLQGRQGEQAMTMVETLAGQLATDPAARAWLVRSWLSPPRSIDGRVLRELTHAVDGRLMREPRFREWLRAEWTAWARQRYRRVLRSVERR